MRKAICRNEGPVLSLLVLTLLVSCQTEPRVPEVIATIPTVGNPHAVVANSRAGYVYIIDGIRHISVFQEDKLITTLPMEHDSILSLAVDEERGWVYAVDDYADSVTVIQGTEVVTTVETAGQAPTDVAVNPQNGWAYVVSGYQKDSEGIRRVVEGNVTVLSGPQVIGAIPLGQMLALHVVADPVNGYVYVGGGTGDVKVGIGGEVVVLERTEVVTRLGMEAPANAMDVDPRTGDVYVLDADYGLSLFRHGERVDRIEPGQEGGALRNMRVHPVTGDVYVVDYLRREVMVVRDMKVIGRAPVGRQPLKMAVDPLTGNVYVANFGDDTVTVIHGTEALATIKVGWYPYGLGVNPANGWVYVSNTNDHSVTVLGFKKGE